MFPCSHPYRFGDNISIKGHMQGEALVVGVFVLLDGVAFGVALFNSEEAR